MPASLSLPAYLAKMPFFATLEPGQIEDFARLATRRRVGEGALVVRQGELDSDLYVVVEGRLQVSTASYDGREIALRVLGPGALFGELALFDRRVRSATVTALEASLLIVFERADVLRALHEHPAIAIKFLEGMALRIRELTARVEQLTELPIAPRVARKLLEMGTEQGQWISGNHLLLPAFVSQTNLAKHVQTTRETINRCLRVFREQGLIQQASDRIEILDCAGLRRVGEVPGLERGKATPE